MRFFRHLRQLPDESERLEEHLAIFQKILFALPFQAIFYTPLMMVTKPNQDVKTLLTSLGIQLFWAVTLFIATRLFYNQAIKVLRIGGG